MTKKVLPFILLLSMILLCGCESGKEGIALNANENGGIYEVSEFLDEARYDEYMNDAGSLFGKLLAFQRRLTNSSEFTFYAFANNFIEIVSHEVPETCIVNHGTEYEKESRYEIGGEKITATEAIQVSENFFTLFPLKISSGRSFEASDFDCRNAQTIPVILGDAYRGAFRLGDTFEGYYLCERRAFIVIGFTDAESDFYLRSGSCMAPYGRFIIMPFENIAQDSFSARAILLQQISGFLAPHDSRASALAAIRAYLTECGLENWREAIVVNEKSLQEKNGFVYDPVNDT